MDAAARVINECGDGADLPSFPEIGRRGAAWARWGVSGCGLGAELGQFGTCGVEVVFGPLGEAALRVVCLGKGAGTVFDLTFIKLVCIAWSSDECEGVAPVGCTGQVTVVAPVRSGC